MANINRPSWQFVTQCAICFLWTSCIFSLVTFLIIWGCFPGPSAACRPDNTFSPFADSYNWWSPNGFFEVTLKGGSLTFGQAKLVDVSWDLIIGRGGQALIVYVSWVTFRKYTAISAQRAPLTLSGFHESFIEPEPPVFRVFTFLRNLKLYNQLYPRCVKVFIAFTLVLTAVFPTIASAATGYTPKFQAYVQELHGNAFIKFSDFEIAVYEILDSSRLKIQGVGNDWTVNYAQLLKSAAEPLISRQDNMLSRSVLRPINIDRDSRCELQFIVDEYVGKYGLRRAGNTSSTFGSKGCARIWNGRSPDGPILTPPLPLHLDPPTLDIETYYLGQDEDNVLLYPPDSSQDASFRSYTRNRSVVFTSGDQTYGLHDIIERGRCQMISDQYQWGFSYIQLFLFSLFLFFWTIGIILVWLKAEINLPLSHYLREVPEGWQCILHMAKTVENELKMVDASPTPQMTDRQLRDLVKQKLDGGEISFGADLEYEEIVGLRQWAWSWCKREPGWTAALLCHIAVFFTMVLLLMLWKRLWFFLVISWVGSLALLLVMLLKLPDLWLIIWGVSWIAIGIELVRVLITRQGYQ
ncbi:hypothetical protein QBC38DRAFT_176088 [Podospora fimiseda]|uniref:Transmembrane protein n=1 Tax=Podospora fimiseda TaxID=252190 RepID=A0AAN7BCE8_9PEZI|nr:hypothetical protein QBC38DRAFT_176088 [Podospora fimiseda]